MEHAPKVKWEGIKREGKRGEKKKGKKENEKAVGNTHKSAAA